MPNVDRYIAALQQGGYRITAQRRTVCHYLAHTDNHPTPYEVYAAVSQEHPDFSRATVYNTLNALRKLGAITEISVGENHTHYETDPSPHVNLVCLRCHRVVDYNGHLPIIAMLEKIQDEIDFCPVAAQVQVMGFCRQCRERRRDEIRQQWRGA